MWWWYWLCEWSERVILKGLKETQHEITIPLDLSPDLLAEFRAVDVAQNPFPLAVFLLWLKHQPQAFEWFEKILHEHEALVRDGAHKLFGSHFTLLTPLPSSTKNHDER